MASAFPRETNLRGSIGAGWQLPRPSFLPVTLSPKQSRSCDRAIEIRSVTAAEYDVRHEVVLESLEMRIEWTAKFEEDVDVIVRKLEGDRLKRSPVLGIHWYLEVVPLLISAIEFGADLVETEKQDILSRCLSELATSGEELTASRLRESIENRTRIFRRTKYQRFEYLTDWSLLDCPRQTRVIHGARVRIGYQLSPASKRARQKSLEAFNNPYLKQPVDSCPVRIVVNARSRGAAYALASNAQETLRGIWNFSLSQDSHSLGTSIPPRPMSSITVGPIHSVRELTHSADEALLWYEDGYPQVNMRTQWAPEIRRFERWALNQIKYSRHGKKLTQAIILYNRALDKTGPDARFLALWALLEFSTGTQQGMTHDKTVKRAAFLGPSSDYDLVVLKYLRDHRNDLAHRSGQSDLRERHTVQLKRHVERLIRFLFDHARDFKHWQDLTGVLDNPTDTASLAAKKDQLKVTKKSIAIARSFAKH